VSGWEEVVEFGVWGREELLGLGGGEGAGGVERGLDTACRSRSRYQSPVGVVGWAHISMYSRAGHIMALEETVGGSSGQSIEGRSRRESRSRVNCLRVGSCERWNKATER